MSEIERGSAQWYQRVAEVDIETLTTPDTWWYISFADPDLPTGTQFLGACYVQAMSLPDAITVSHERGCNPGGQAAVLGPLPTEEMGNVPDDHRNRLLSRSEIEAEG